MRLGKNDHFFISYNKIETNCIMHESTITMYPFRIMFSLVLGYYIGISIGIFKWMTELSISERPHDRRK